MTNSPFAALAARFPGAERAASVQMDAEKASAAEAARAIEVARADRLAADAARKAAEKEARESAWTRLDKAATNLSDLRRKVEVVETDHELQDDFSQLGAWSGLEHDESGPRRWVAVAWGLAAPTEAEVAAAAELEEALAAATALRMEVRVIETPVTSRVIDVGGRRVKEVPVEGRPLLTAERRVSDSMGNFSWRRW